LAFNRLHGVISQKIRLFTHEIITVCSFCFKKEGRNSYGRREMHRRFDLENLRDDITLRKCRWEDNIKTDIREMVIWVGFN
jgi:hypothetical protein